MDRSSTKAFEQYDKCHLGDNVFINNKKIDDVLIPAALGGWIRAKFRTTDFCPFCYTKMLSVTLDFGEYIKETTLWSCNYCAYWQWYLPDFYEVTAYVAKARVFNDALPECLPSELAQAFRRSPKLWSTINSHKLEVFIADVLRANYAPCEVIHVGKPDDKGVDVLFIDADKEQWLVQVKRRQLPTASEGISTVRNLLGAMIVAGNLRGILVSTADHFTYRANEAIGRAKEFGMTVELVDRNKLNRMLDPIIPQNPWYSVVASESKEELAKKFTHQIDTFSR